MDNFIDFLGDATVFSTLHANWGYLQIEKDEQDRYKTAFLHHHGLHRFKRMQFGFAVVYLDDVVIFWCTSSEHITSVWLMLTLLRDAGVSLKLPKYSFFPTKLTISAP